MKTRGIVAGLHCSLTQVGMVYCIIVLIQTKSTGGSVAEWLGRWTCDQQVAISSPGLPAVECNPGQVVNTCASVTKQYNLVPANGR